MLQERCCFSGPYFDIIFVCLVILLYKLKFSNLKVKTQDITETIFAIGMILTFNDSITNIIEQHSHKSRLDSQLFLKLLKTLLEHISVVIVLYLFKNINLGPGWWHSSRMFSLHTANLSKTTVRSPSIVYGPPNQE